MFLNKIYKILLNIKIKYVYFSIKINREIDILTKCRKWRPRGEHHSDFGQLCM